jgi:hypothetical protein
MQRIVGLKVVGVYGYTGDKRKNYIEPQYILFDDGKTYIELEEQDYYTFHDCSGCAREIYIKQDEKFWNTVFNNVDYDGNALKRGKYLKSNTHI